MNILSRELISFGVIVCSVCVGAWIVFVQPGLTELEELRNEIQQHDSPATDVVAVQQLAAQADTLRKRLSDIERSNAIGNDSTQLYNVMMDLARSEGVQVQSLQPGAQQQEQSEFVSLRRVTMSVTGSYPQIASFVRVVNQRPEFIRPQSIALLPRHGSSQRGVVLANLAWDVLTFTVPDELNFIGGVDHARP